MTSFKRENIPAHMNYIMGILMLERPSVKGKLTKEEL
jgi:hypothetical protein